MHCLTKLDYIAFSIVTLAYTTVRRVGAFLPKTKKETETFPYILPWYILSDSSNSTLLIWLPKSKTDPEGRGTVLTVKSTNDDCCPIALLNILLQGRAIDEPLFSHLSTTQPNRGYCNRYEGAWQPWEKTRVGTVCGRYGKRQQQQLA